MTCEPAWKSPKLVHCGAKPAWEAASYKACGASLGDSEAYDLVVNQIRSLLEMLLREVVKNLIVSFKTRGLDWLTWT